MTRIAFGLEKSDNKRSAIDYNASINVYEIETRTSPALYPRPTVL
jgi:hypothetical protein